MAFHGINDTADLGDDKTDALVESVSALVVKTKILSVGNEGSSGVTFFIDYTKGSGAETSITIAASIIAPSIDANDYQIPLLASGSISALSITLSASGRWAWPIALPALTPAYVVLTMTAVGTPGTDTVVTINAMRDSLNGR